MSLVQDDVVALGVRGPEAEHAPRSEEPLVNDPVEQALRVVEELARRGLLEDRRELALQLPGVEEELPVDVLAERGEVGLDQAAAGELRHGQVVERDAVPVRARLRERQQRLALLLGVQVAQPILVGAVLGVEPHAPLGIEQVGDDADDARGVEDVDDRLRVRGRDPHRRVLARRRGAADQQRQVDPAPLHLARDVDHLVERRRDQPGQPDDVGLLLDRVSRIRSAGTITPRSITS